MLLIIIMDLASRTAANNNAISSTTNFSTNDKQYDDTTIVPSKSLNNCCETPTATYINKEVLNLWYHEEFEAYHVTTKLNSNNEELLDFGANNSRSMPEVCKFDTDVYQIGVDSYTYCCISPYIHSLNPSNFK